MTNKTCNKRTCNKTFANEDGLYQHKLATLHSCEKCEHPFPTRNDVKLHMRTHKEYPCPVCSRRFFLLSSSIQHLRDTRKHGRRENQSKPIGAEIAGAGIGSGKTPPQRSCPVFINELQTYESIERFMKEKVRPDSENMANCRNVVIRIAEFLQNRTNFSVAEVFKGGSFAKGTSIKAKSDIDLLVFLNGVTMSALEDEMEDKLNYLKDHFLNGANFTERVKFTGRHFTRHSIQFELKCTRNDVDHSVDLLPAVDLLKTGTHLQESKKSVYRQMLRETPHMRSFYSVCLGKLQVDFVKHRPKRVKDLIRLVKHWKVTEGFLELKSYSVELLVIKQWMLWGKPKRFDLKERFKQVMHVLSDLGKIRIGWPECYDVKKYGGWPKDKVIIMDPANPFCNTADRLSREDLSPIEEKARETARRL